MENGATANADLSFFVAGYGITTDILVTMVVKDEDNRRKVRAQPPALGRGLRVFGENAASWRKLQRLSVDTVAARAGISRDTLRAIEAGRGTASLENTFRVLRVLGVLDRVIEASDPYDTDVGRLRADEVLPQRVRR
jgi:DNA-binding XRE family transcriptional regulator